MKKKVIVISIFVMISLLSATFIISGFEKRYDITLESFSLKENNNKMNLHIKTKQNEQVRKIQVTQKGEKQYITFYSDFRLFNIRIGSKNEYEISLDRSCKEIYFDKGNGDFVLVLKKNDKTENWERYQEELLTDKELEDMQYVDDKIEQLSSSQEYKEMSIEEKATEMEKLLKDLKEKKYIKDYNYSSDNYLFSYEYECGVLGGIMLKDFDPMLN